MTKYDLEKNFQANECDKYKQHTMLIIRDRCRNTANEILRTCPDSRERSLALTKIEEAMMWANAAIARNE